MYLLLFIGEVFGIDIREGSKARQLPALQPDHADRSHQRLLTFLEKS